MMTLRQARTGYRRILKATADDSEMVRAGRFHKQGQGAEAKRHQGWVDYLNKLCRNGELSRLQAEHADNHDTFMPHNDQKFVLERMNVKFKADQIDDRPDKLMDGANMTHYLCTLAHKSYVHTLYFSMGEAHTEPPTVDQVMYAMLMDAAAVNGLDTPEDYVDEFVSDKNDEQAVSQAKAAYYGCIRQQVALSQMFSRDTVELLYELFENY